MSDNAADAPRWTPAPWLNKMMVWMLRTPGLQRIVGRGTALITFTGRKTGRRITTPVSYVEIDDQIVTTCHRTRQWWRNLAADPHVGIRLVGEDRRGIATVMDDPDNALNVFTALVEAQPVVAKISGIPLGSEGEADRAKVREILAYTVVVSIKLEEE
jgi:deazaflavin-dependent oxidoreductase (nitroreductase family)